MAHPHGVMARAKVLRGRGVSVPSIAVRLGIAKSTAFRWVRGTTLSARVVQTLARKSVYGRQKGLARIREVRLLQDAQRRAEAVEHAQSTMRRFDRLWWQCTAALLFWCEGSKQHLSSMKFINSDPLMVRVFLKALRRGFRIDSNKLTAMLHLHGFHREAKMIAYWSRATGIPPERFYPSYIKSNTGKRKRAHYRGCISICYGDANLARKLDALYRALAKRMGA